MFKKGWPMAVALFLLLALGLPTVASATAPSIAEARTEFGENRVVYPQLEGMEDEALQQQINDDMITKAELMSRIITLSTLREGGWGLVVEYEAFLTEGLLSVVVNAKGTMANGRNGQKYSAMCYDLQTGEPIGLDRIFADPEAAVAWMEERVEATLADELSGYLENSNLTPLPVDNFALDKDGITFYYPAEQFSLHSGYGGACQFYYSELADFLSQDEILAGIDVEKQEYAKEEALEKITEILKQGRVPHVPVAIGDDMTQVVEKYRLVREPDRYPGGRYYQMEAPAFRQVFILSDDMGSGYANSIVQGIQSTRGNLYGIQAGKTQRADWREILGEPENVIVFTENLAYDYGLPVGESDIYAFGEFQLRLHGNEKGVLHSIRLSR